MKFYFEDIGSERISQRLINAFKEFLILEKRYSNNDEGFGFLFHGYIADDITSSYADRITMIGNAFSKYPNIVSQSNCCFVFRTNIENNYYLLFVYAFDYKEAERKILNHIIEICSNIISNHVKFAFNKEKYV